jgi:hypothetical protein
VTRFIDHLYTRLGNISTYSATADLHNTPITTAPAKPFPACCVFTNRSLTTASTIEILQLHALRLSSQPPMQNSRELTYCVISSQPPLQSSTELVAPVLFFVTPRRGPCRQHPFSNSSCTVEYVFVSAGVCLPSRCSETVWYNRPSHDRCIATAILATIHISPSALSFFFKCKYSLHHFVLRHLYFILLAWEIMFHTPVKLEPK